MKKILTVFLICISLIYSQTLQQQIDSLQKTAGTLHDSAKCRIQNELSALYRNIDPEQSNKHAEDALALSKKSGTINQTIQALINLGICQYIRGENAKAFAYYYDAKEMAESINSKFFLAKVYNNIGAVYFNLGDYNRTLEFYLKSQTLRQAINDREGMAASLNNLGNVYLRLGNYALSLEQYQKSLEMKKETSDKEGTIQSLMNLGSVYKYLPDYPRAMEYYEKALRLGNETGNNFFVASALGNIGGLFATKSDYTKALEYHFKSLPIRRELGDVNGEALCLVNIGEINFELKNYSGALRFIAMGLDISKKAELTEIEKNAYFLLSQINEKTGNYKDAYANLQKYNDLHDSLFNSAKANEIGRLQERNEIEKTLFEKQRRETEQANIAAAHIQHRNTIQYFTIFLAVIVLFVAVFFTGRVKMRESVAEGIAFFAFLMLYEFISVLLDPALDTLAKSIPIMKLAINAFIALLMIPVHDILENALEKKVLKK